VSFIFRDVRPRRVVGGIDIPGWLTANGINDIEVILIESCFLAEVVQPSTGSALKRFAGLGLI
jgi:hypothetical protein